MIAAFSLAGAYLILLGLAIRSRTRRDPSEGWLLALCTFSIVLMLLHGLLLSPYLLPGIAPYSQLLAVVGFVVSVTLTGFLTITYLGLRRQATLLWAALSVAWAASTGITQALNIPAITGGQIILLPAASVPMTLSLELLTVGWLLLALCLFGIIARAFLTEKLPLYANRILFWFVVIPPLLLGDALSAWLNPPWNYVGYITRLIGVIGAVYGITSHRVLDLRDTARWIISRSILALVTGGLVAGAILASDNLQYWIQPSAYIYLVAGLGLAGALILPPARQVTRWLLGRLIDRGQTDAAEAVRLYSQRISGLIDLKDLAATSSRTTRELFSTHQSCLILATQRDDSLSLEVFGSDRADRIRPGSLALTSPIYSHFINGRGPLPQYDIDYHKDYLAVPPGERRYFSGLEMDIYAPIISDGKLLGMLALGPKGNDDPYRSSEMELLSALANQTVAALENARLVSDLRSLNREISSLNQDLNLTNERLERLDSVKSDFIAIASHELRTPLTQIQGYVDLLLEMSERNLLTPEQITDIMTSLRRASLRMGEVISSMLDVSQIDVDNMDLNFVETSLASIIKLAIEPYSDAIHNRNLTLVARGLRNLPPIHGDYKRLVQAFENLITNAIKFTPDGGKINVSGEVFERDADGQPRSVRIIVEDSGIGIAKEHHELIFEKFYRIGSTQLHSTGTTKFKGAGPGLGLPITRGIIEGHGGRIWVESPRSSDEENPGSAFHIVLPISPPAMDARERLSHIQEGAEAASDRSVLSPAAPDSPS